MKKIAIIGAGGFGKEVFCIWRDLLNSENQSFEFIGFFDDSDKVIENPYGKIIGKIDDLNGISEEVEVAIAIGNTIHLKTIKEKINNTKIKFPNIIHPSTMFFDHNVFMGEGNIFSLGCIVSCNVSIGDFNIFNTRTTIAHDVEIGNYNVFSPNAQISGAVNIKDQNYFGFNCGVIQGRKIGSNNTIAAGSTLLRNIKDSHTYIGNPARKLGFNKN
ncbi:NeuD/PglB/VioB family sugar acetyltransferase [Weeksellaceae bacterium TAE3-ERU29]|nr:NeuD/PglB/VioB family sugar acetyltransferase [Weeksellaceae bacterium TAE3-ERU29]